MKKEKNKLQIRNSTAEFLIFTRQAGEDGYLCAINGTADGNVAEGL